MKDKDGSVHIELLGRDGLAVVAFTAPSLCQSDDVTNVSDRIRTFVDQQEPRALVFDFAGVKFFSSQLLGLLLDVRARIVQAGGKAVISAIEPQLHRVFKITNLDKIFEFYPDKNTAVAELSSRKTRQD